MKQPCSGVEHDLFSKTCIIKIKKRVFHNTEKILIYFHSRMEEQNKPLIQITLCHLFSTATRNEIFWFLLSLKVKDSKSNLKKNNLYYNFSFVLIVIICYRFLNNYPHDYAQHKRYLLPFTMFYLFSCNFCPIFGLLLP